MGPEQPADTSAAVSNQHKGPGSSSGPKKASQRWWPEETYPWRETLAVDLRSCWNLAPEVGWNSVRKRFFSVGKRRKRERSAAGAATDDWRRCGWQQSEPYDVDFRPRIGNGGSVPGPSSNVTAAEIWRWDLALKLGTIKDTKCNLSCRLRKPILTCFNLAANFTATFLTNSTSNKGNRVSKILTSHFQDERRWQRRQGHYFLQYRKNREGSKLYFEKHNERLNF